MVLVKKGAGKAYVGLDLQSAVHIQRFASVCKALKSSTLPIDNKQNLTEAFLATISAQLFQHYQQCYGKSSPKPRPFTIPPTRLFWDFEADGALFVMLSTLLSSASVRDLAPLDKLFERDAALLLPILHEIDKNLSLFGYTTTPKIFLNSVPVGLIQKLSKIAVEHSGELVSSEELATHVLDWNDDVDSAADGAVVDEANARVIDYKPLNEDGSGSLYLVHWPFLPDSANEWLPEAQLALTAAEQQVAVLGRRDKPRYYVSCRFLLDVDTFNEWGNEGDYEASAGVGGGADGADDDAAADALPAATATMTTPAGRKTAKGRGRRSSAAAVSAVKAQTQAKDAPAPPLATALYEKLLADVLPPALTRSIFQTTPPPTGRVLDVDFTGARLVTAGAASSSSSTAAGSLSKAPSQANLAASAEAKEADAVVPAAPAAPSSSSGSGVTKKRKFDDLAADGGSGAAPGEPLLWLRLDRVSDLERRLLGYVVQEHRPQGVSTYLQLRNAMLQLYAQRPAQYLSATECRRKIAGDVARLTRIHEFLDAFGAINYAVKAEARPVFAGGAPGYDDDVSLSLRRRHLVDRLARQFPSCAVHAQAADPHATSHWHAAMDARLVTLLLEKSMDWPAISRDMAAWLEAQYAAPAPAAPAAADEAAPTAATATAATTTADAMDTDPPAATEASAAAAPTVAAAAAAAPSAASVDGDSDATLRAMTSTQRAALVTPLLCMLRFMEMQLAAVVRTAAASTAAAAPTATSAANGAVATATVPAAVTASNGAVVKEEAAAASTTAAATAAPAASSSGSSGSGDRAHALFVQLASLAQRPPPTTATAAASPWATDKERAVLTRLVAAVTHLQQLDALLGDLRAENAALPPSAAAAAPTTTTAAAGDDDDAAASGGMDVDDDGDSGAAPAAANASTTTPTSAAQAAVASFAASLVAAITAETTTFLASLRDRQRSLTEAMFVQRLAALEDKLALASEVDAVLALEREQLEADKRDFALQRLLHLSTSVGIALSVPNTITSGGPALNANGNSNGAVPHAASLPALTLGGGGGGGLTTSSSSAALNAL